MTDATYQHRTEELRSSRRVEMPEIEKAIKTTTAKYNAFLKGFGSSRLPEARSLCPSESGS